MDKLEFGRKEVNFGTLSFSEKEIRDIIKAWIAISIAYAFVLGGGFNLGIFNLFIISAITVGIGFIAHELGHKFLAQKYGAIAEFRSFDQFLILGLMLAIFVQAIFIAPGAVMIFGRTIGKSRAGKISAMGPVMSMSIAIIFLITWLFTRIGTVATISEIGFSINSWLALFNLIPVAVLDGKKIWQWNKAIYFLLVAIALILIAAKYFLMPANF